MQWNQDTWVNKVKHHAIARVKVVSRHGVPAHWQAHMRALTTARQAAVRHHYPSIIRRS